MKKVYSMFLVFCLVFVLLSGMTVFADDLVIAGNDVIQRDNGPDSWTNFYLADTNNGFEDDYIMTGFSAYVARLSQFKFVVFTKEDDNWKILWESELITPTEMGIYTGNVEPGVFVPSGSYVGLYYPGNGAVPYSVGTDVGDSPFETGVLTRTVLFTNNNNGLVFVDFYNSGDRVYSIQATGMMVPKTEWLTPISNENFKLNIKATLPIKFRLDGEFDDVKLMINDIEVAIDFKECEEECDFYMGIFRPSEIGDYTATVLVNGVPVLTKEFVVFENIPNGNVKVEANVKAEVKAKIKGNK